MSSSGQVLPAITPVLSVDRSKLLKLDSSSSAINMVGTPCNPVHFSSSTVRSVVSGSNDSPGNTAHAPDAKQTKLPNTIPKQW